MSTGWAQSTCRCARGWRLPPRRLPFAAYTTLPLTSSTRPFGLSTPSFSRLSPLTSSLFTTHCLPRLLSLLPLPPLSSHLSPLLIPTTPHPLTTAVYQRGAVYLQRLVQGHHFHQRPSRGRSHGRSLHWRQARQVPLRGPTPNPRGALCAVGAHAAINRGASEAPEARFLAALCAHAVRGQRLSRLPRPLHARGGGG